MAKWANRLGGAVGVAGLLAALQTTARPEPASAQLAAMEGIVFVDADGDGVRGSGEGPLGGVTVVAFAADGSEVGRTASAADGTWSIASAGSVRIEFSGIPTPYRPAPLAANLAGSTTRFADPGDSGIDLGVWDPATFAAEVLAVPNFSFGPAGASSGQPAVFAFPSAVEGELTDETTRAAAGVRTAATDDRIGAVYGLASDPERPGGLFAAAFMKRHVGIKDTPGTIFRLGPDGTVEVFTRLAAGADTHPTSTAEEDWLLDLGTWDAPGKLGLGDLDLGPGGQDLYTVNLATQSLVRIPIGAPDSAVSIAVPVAAGCTVGDWRPFGLGIQGANVLVGAVCSKQSDGVADANFAGHVLAFDPAGGTFTSLLSFPLQANFPRKCAATTLSDNDKNTEGNDQVNDPDDTCNQSTYPAANARFVPWLPADGSNVDFASRSGDLGVYNQSPLISDFEMTPEGNMAIGIRVRFGDQAGSPGRAPNLADTKLYEGIAMGDLLLACPVGGVWTLENNGSCAALTSGGVDNREGPGGGEFFADDDTYWHDQTYLGSSVYLPSTGEMAIAAFDPLPGLETSFDLGVNFASPSDGAAGDRFLMLWDEGYAAGGVQDIFSKANGLGDLELLAMEAGVEVGNRVWRDADRDGVQDPGEPGIAGVTLTLRCGTAPERSTTTDNDGRYVYTNLDAGAACAISAATGQTPLTGLTLTGADVAGAGADCAGQADSDAELAEGGAAAIISVTVGAPGANNHDCDVGFAPSLVESCLGDRVVLDTDADGVQDPGEAGLAGVRVHLTDASGADAGQPQVTDSQGYYRYCGLAPASYGVRFEFPAGYDVSPRDRGSDDVVDCDADPTTGKVAPISLGASEINLTLDTCVHPRTVVRAATAALPFTGSAAQRAFWLAVALLEFGALALLLARLERRLQQR